MAEILNHGKYKDLAHTQRAPDLLISGRWGLEFKIVRPFGDNGLPAENWSVNLLHPYQGNVSALGDCLKLLSLKIPEKKAVAAICFEHTPPRINLQPLFDSFELIAGKIMGLDLGPRIVEKRIGLVHPVLQQLLIVSWEVLGYKTEAR